MFFLEEQLLDLSIENLFTLGLDTLKPGFGICLILQRSCRVLSSVFALLVNCLMLFFLLSVNHGQGLGFDLVSHSVDVDPPSEKLVTKFASTEALHHLVTDLGHTFLNHVDAPGDHNSDEPTILNHYVGLFDFLVL